MAKSENNSKPFLNPFEAGVNYDMFMEAKGEVSVEDYCKDHLTKEQINFLVEDLKHYVDNTNARKEAKKQLLG